MSLMTNSERSRHAEEDEISLPEELLIDILWRMPGKSVFKFRRLSKYYKELIDSDYFIEKHYEESIKKRPNVILHQRIDRCNIEPFVVIHLDFASDVKVDEFRPPFKKSRFLGCHRGILCYQIQELQEQLISWKPRYLEEQLIFWNPVTGVSRRSTIMSWPDRGFPDRYFLGYDALTNDFKVLKITQRQTPGKYSGYAYDCMVYSSKTDSWKGTQGFDHIRLRLDMVIGYTTSEGTGAEVFVEGTKCVHMIAAEQEMSYAKHILAFDFMSENFNLVPSPKRGMLGDQGLSCLDGCLCFYYQTDDHCLNAWMMKEYGVEESWTPLLSIHLDSISGMKPFGFAVNNGRPKLMLVSSGFSKLRELYFYDLHKKQLDDTQRHYMLQNYSWDIPQHFLFTPSHRQP